MRLAIISDCHFGFNEDALPQAREAMQKALQLQADAIILPGDIYDVRVPKQETLHETAKLFMEIRQQGKKLDERKEGGRAKVLELLEKEERSLENEGVPILAIWGTHERRSKGLANVIQIMNAAGLLTNLHTRIIILEKNGERVAIQGLGGVPEEYFRRTLEVAEFHPLQKAFNIFVFHQNLAELLPFEKEEFVAMEELPPGFQLYINGHIHWNHDLHLKGRRLLVPGSTVVTQMKKNEERPKGFYLFDTVTQKAEFIKIQGRPFHFRELKFENAPADEMKGAIEKELAAILKETHLKPPLVKIKLSGTVKRQAIAMLDLDRLIRSYSGKAMLYIDKDFESEGLKEKIEMLRKARQEGKGAKELGMEILKNKIKEKNLHLKDAQELFELLAEGEIEEAIAHV